MKKVFFAAAVLLALALFFFFRANDPARERMRERERIEKEIGTCQDSLKVYIDSLASDSGLTIKRILPGPGWTPDSPRFKYTSTPRRDSLSFCVKFHRSRCDSLNRVLEGIPDE